MLPCTNLKARAAIYFLNEKKAELAALLVYVEGQGNSVDYPSVLYFKQQKNLLAFLVFSPHMYL